jgi:hypothetical protein
MTAFDTLMLLRQEAKDMAEIHAEMEKFLQELIAD